MAKSKMTLFINKIISKMSGIMFVIILVNPKLKNLKFGSQYGNVSRESPNWSVTLYLFLVWNYEAVTDYLKFCLLRDLQNIEGTSF